MEAEDLNALLGDLPLQADAAPGDAEIVLDGYLLLSPHPECLRIIVGDLCLDIMRDGVTNVEPLPGQEQRQLLSSELVRLFLRAAIRLWGVYPSEPFRNLTTSGRRPFSFVSCADEPAISASPKFRKLEEDYLIGCGLMERPPDPHRR